MYAMNTAHAKAPKTKNTFHSKLFCFVFSLRIRRIKKLYTVRHIIHFGESLPQSQTKRLDSDHFAVGVRMFLLFLFWLFFSSVSFVVFLLRVICSRTCSLTFCFCPYNVTLRVHATARAFHGLLFAARSRSIAVCSIRPLFLVAVYVN